jgi:hypothetical protein
MLLVLAPAIHFGETSVERDRQEASRHWPGQGGEVGGKAVGRESAQIGPRTLGGKTLVMLMPPRAAFITEVNTWIPRPRLCNKHQSSA